MNLILKSLQNNAPLQPQLRGKLLKIDVIRLKILREFLPKDKYIQALNKTITLHRSLINAKG